MDASDLIKALQNPCEKGAVHIWVYPYMDGFSCLTRPLLAVAAREHKSPFASVGWSRKRTLKMTIDGRDRTFDLWGHYQSDSLTRRTTSARSELMRRIGLCFEPALRGLYIGLSILMI